MSRANRISLLYVDELSPVIDSNDTAIAKTFALLQLSSAVSTGYFVMIDKKIHEQTVKHFTSLKNKLSKLTLSIRKFDGSLFNFGTGNADAIQNTWIFKVVHSESHV